MQIEEMADQIKANGDCLMSFAKAIRVMETRDAEQLAAVLKAFLENDDPGNTSFAEIALPVLTGKLCMARQKGSWLATRPGARRGPGVVHTDCASETQSGARP